MTDAQFTTIVNSIRKEIYDRTPYLTGNLAENATRIESLGVNEMRVYIDINIAPYFKYVNDYDLIGGRWDEEQGRMVDQKPNGNYHYWERAVEESINIVVRLNGGMLIEEGNESV